MASIMDNAAGLESAEAPSPASNIIGDVGLSEDKYISKDTYGVSGDADTWDKGLTPDQVNTVRDEYAKIELVRLSRKKTETLPLEVKQAALSLGQLKSGDISIHRFRENHRFLYEITDDDKVILEQIRQNFYPRSKTGGGDEMSDVSGMASTPNVLSRFLSQGQ